MIIRMLVSCSVPNRPEFLEGEMYLVDEELGRTLVEREQAVEEKDTREEKKPTESKPDKKVTHAK